MNFTDTYLTAAKNLWRGKTRSILTVLSILIGVSSVIIVSSVGKAGTNLISNEIEQMGLQGISIYQNKNELTLPLYAEDVTKLKKRFKSIEFAIPVILDFATFRLNKTEGDTVVFGIGEAADKVYNVNLLYGRAPDISDINNSKPVAVIDDELALKSYKRVNVVGKKMMIYYADKREEVTIIGVISSQKQGISKMFGNNIPDFIYLPYTTLNKMRNSEEISQIAIKCSYEYTNDGIEFVKYLSKIKRVNNGYLTENISSRIDDVKKITDMALLIISAVAAVTLLVAGIGIMNTMFSSTMERKREIGICMAIGATSGDILKSFFAESIILAILGGAAGAIIGSIIGVIVSKFVGLSLLLNVKVFIIAELVSILCSVIFSAIPAYKASQLDPIKALRHN